MTERAQDTDGLACVNGQHCADEHVFDYQGDKGGTQPSGMYCTDCDVHTSDGGETYSCFYTGRELRMSEVVKSVNARLCLRAEMKNPGDFAWAYHKTREQIVAICLMCPACGETHGVPVKPGDPNGWDWNGDQDKPTLQPSIFFREGHITNRDCRWHGYLTNGVFENA